jgi:hypothetical protein
MEQAIGMDPEVIYLLSDGFFDPQYVEMITARNHMKKHPSKIHCIGLVEDNPNLREIARRNGGMYWQAK